MKKLLLVIIFLSASVLLNAQTSSTTVVQTIKLFIKTVILINFISATDTSVNLSNRHYYINSKTKAKPSTFDVRSNRPWTVTIDTTTTVLISAGSDTVAPPSLNHEVYSSKKTAFYPLLYIPATARLVSINGRTESIPVRSVIYTASQY